MVNVSIEIFDLKESQALVLYRNVWSQSIDASPFISPRILDILIGEGKQLDVAFFYYDTQIIGAFPYSITDGCWRDYVGLNTIVVQTKNTPLPKI